MSPQEIGLIVVLAVIAVYGIAAWFSRSKSGEEPADIILEARVPGSRPSKELLDLKIDAAPLRNTKNRRRNKKRPSVEAAVEAPPTQKKPAADTPKQRHHASPSLKGKPSPETTESSAPAKKPAPERKPVQAAAPAPAPVPGPAPKAREKAKAAPAEVIDPKLTGQISELDTRLDAIEKLVASIEESLATFEEADADSASTSGEVRAA